MNADITRFPDGITLSKSPTKPEYKDYNKSVIQSYILTTARYDFNVYEKRIIYALIKIAQEQILGLDFKNTTDCRKIKHDLFGYTEITLPFYSVLKNEEDKNHAKIKKALLSLQKKVIQYEDNKIWLSFTLVVSPKIKKNESTISFKIDPVMWDCILDFSKGFRKIELLTTMQFESVYAMRFYELFSNQKTPITFEIEYLKEMFQVGKKYKLNADFFRYVIEPAKKELDAKSPYSFDYKINKQGRKFHSITFYPKQIPQNKKPEIEKTEIQKQVSPMWILDAQTLRYLTNEYNFTSREITQWYDLFKEAQQKIDLLRFVAEKKRYAETAKNPKGYIISCIQKELEKLNKKISLDNKVEKDIKNTAQKRTYNE